MYICLCKAVTEHKLRSIISKGANNIKDIQEESKAGTNCGSCLCEIEDMLNSQKDKQKSKRLQFEDQKD